MIASYDIPMALTFRVCKRVDCFGFSFSLSARNASSLGGVSLLDSAIISRSDFGDLLSQRVSKRVWHRWCVFVVSRF